MNEPKVYPEWFINLINDVYQMREAQKAYFAQRDDYRLKLSIAKEQRVDQHLAKFNHEGIVKVASKQDSKQQNLFNEKVHTDKR